MKSKLCGVLLAFICYALLSFISKDSWTFDILPLTVIFDWDKILNLDIKNVKKQSCKCESLSHVQLFVTHGL